MHWRVVAVAFGAACLSATLMGVPAGATDRGSIAAEMPATERAMGAESANGPDSTKVVRSDTRWDGASVWEW